MATMTPQAFATFDEYAAALGHSSLRIMALAKASERWETGRCFLDDVYVRRARDGGPSFFEAAIEEDGVGLMVCPGAAGKVSGNGVMFGPRSVMIVPRRTEIQSVSFEAVTWLSAFIPASRLRVAGEYLDDIARIPCGVIHSPVAEVGRFCETLQRVVTAALAGAFVANPLGRSEAASELVATARHLLWPHHPQEHMFRLGRKMIPRPEIIRRVLGFLERNPGAPASLDDLAEAAGVSHRTLHNAFCEQFGVSPKRFLRLRALNLARRGLAGADPDCTRVTDIAVRLGIWELGRFSRDYHALFGELPSQTLRRSL